MKPLVLEVEGFGPFREKQVLPFDRLDALFVISGDTGAGKTTLFDAISYALYGEPLGRRGADDIRSSFLAPDERTLVRFRFACGGQTWEVTRSARLKKKRDASAAPELVEEVGLLHLDEQGRPVLAATQQKKLTRTEINEFLARDVLKLSHEEFAKILVLPQGEFQHFLELDSKERGAVLGKLFPIGLHQRLAERARTAAATSVGQVKDLESRRAQLLETFAPDQYLARREALVAQVTTLGEQAQLAEVKAHASRDALLAAKTLREQLATLSTVREEEAAHAARKAEVEQHRQRMAEAQRAAPAEAPLRQRHHAETEAKARELALQQTRATATTHQQAVEQLAPEAEQLPARQAALEAERRALDGLALVKRQLETVQQVGTSLLKARSAAATHGTQAQTAADRVTVLQGELEALQRVQERRLALTEPLQHAEARRSEREALRRSADAMDAELRERPARERETGARAQRVADCEETARTATEALHTAEARRDAQRAADLARHLTDGQPCPVCGGTEHPHPATFVEDGTDLAAWLAREKAAVEKAQTTWERARTDQATFAAQQQERAQAVEVERVRLTAAGFGSTTEWREALAQAETDARRLREEAQQLTQQVSGRAAKEQEKVQAQRVADQAHAAALQAAQAVTALEGQLAQATAGLEPNVDPAVELPRVVETLRQRTQAAQQQKQAVEALGARWQSLQQDGARVAAAVTSAEAEHAGAQARLTTARAQETAALATAGFASAEALLAALLSAPQQAQLEQAITAWTRRQTELETRRAELEAHVAGRTPPELAPLEAAAQLDAQASAEVREARGRAVQDGEALEAAKRRYDALQAELAALEGASRGLHQLAKDLAGDNPLNLSFPTWVLAYWFERVLERATARLEKLSEGRYLFLRHGDKVHGNKQAGLGLDVYDTHATATRDVKTLSGGEKFLASLSLALGLADVIQERAGGVELDTLFIDEGFGSLDPSTMDRALAVLDEIGAHRQVGVISHVAGVKEAIPCHVVVRRTAVGSTVELPQR